jgi:Tfp pilus assembly protein PilF
MLWKLLLLALQFDPRYSPKFAEATRQVEQRNYAAARAALEELTRDQPHVGDYWHLLGVVAAASGELKEAEMAFEKACRAEQKPPRACYQWGRILQASGRHEEALGAFTAAPRGGIDAATLTARALSLEVLGRYRAADDAYRAALAESALRPRESAEIQQTYASFLIRQRQWEAALWQLRQVLRKQPFAGDAWRLQAGVLLELQRLDEAADSLEQAIAHGQRSRENLRLLSEVYRQLGDSDKAERYRREAAPPEL